MSLGQTGLMGPGHLACPGCGAALAMKYALQALGPRTMVIMPAGCWSTFIGVYPYTSLRVPVMSVAFASTAATASGVRAGLDLTGREEVTVLAWAGDGGTYDIGIQALSGAAERNEDIIFICYDNEAYMNTGIQRSSSTPLCAWTTTTPGSAPKPQPKKDIMAIMAAHRVPYAATASIAYPQDLRDKLTRALDIKGTRFIHLYASCPTGWRHEPDNAVELARQAVESRLFPLYEVRDGKRFTLSPMPDKMALTDYLESQGRFRFMSPEDIEAFQVRVDEDWQELLAKTA